MQLKIKVIISLPHIPKGTGSKMFGNCCCGKHGDVEISKNGTSSEEVEIKQRRFTFKENLQFYAKEYCDGGTIHGFKYLAENRTIFEKIWWVISIILSITLCVFLVIVTYDRWENAPVLVSFATKETSIWEVPFPAITICPETKSRPTIFNYSKYLDLKKHNVELTTEEEEKFGYLSLICERKSGIVYKSHHLSKKHVFDFFDQVQPKFMDNISECKYLGENYNCSDLFFPIMTDEGVCYTFNLLDRSEIFTDVVTHYKNYHSAPKSEGWSLEKGYNSNVGIKTYPKRALFSGAKYALEAKLTIYDDELDYDCGSSLLGWKIQVSHPSRMPRVREQHFQVPLDKSVKAAVLPDMTVTSDAVKNYDPSRRNCYFPSERPLQFFKIYTQQNCQIECKTRYTYKKCGCTNFYMPRFANMSVCSAGMINCIYEAEHDLLFTDIKQNLMRKQGQQIDDEIDCDCLPICTSMYYKEERSMSDWNWRNKYPLKPGEDIKRYNQKHMSYFQVFMKGNQFITLDRSELFGPTDFLANFGGLLGLCIGFSLLTLIEVIYYLTVRIVCNIILYGKRNWSGKID